MLGLQLSLLILPAIICSAQYIRQPVYKYRYETEDVMNTAATGVPVHGYHLVESGFYPHQQFSPFGSNSFAFRPNSNLRNFGHFGGGEAIHQHNYQDGKQQVRDDSYKNAGVSSALMGKANQQGSQRGEAKIRNDKTDSASFRDAQAHQQSANDGKTYSGDQHFQQQGKNTDEAQAKKGHRKGHVVKGFKTSHHKDETGHTEEYYDEGNDEGGTSYVKGASGSFGQQEQNTYKGGHDNGQFNANEQNKQSQTGNVHVVDNANANKGDFSEKKSYEQGQMFGVNNGADRHSLLGHQESSRLMKHHPHHVPFYNV